MSDAILISDWNEVSFHRRVLAYEKKGYIARRETYRIVPEANPETGEITHLRTIEMFLPELIAEEQ